MCKQSELRSNVPWWTLIQDVQKGEHHDEEDLVVVVVVVVVAAETAGVALLVVVVYCGVLGGWRILEFFWYLCFLHMAYNVFGLWGFSLWPHEPSVIQSRMAISVRCSLYMTRSQGTARQRAMKDKKKQTTDDKSIQETMVDAWKEKPG